MCICVCKKEMQCIYASNHGLQYLPKGEVSCSSAHKGTSTLLKATFVWGSIGGWGLGLQFSQSQSHCLHFVSHSFSSKLTVTVTVTVTSVILQARSLLCTFALIQKNVISIQRGENMVPRPRKLCVVGSSMCLEADCEILCVWDGRARKKATPIFHAAQAVWIFRINFKCHRTRGLICSHYPDPDHGKLIPCSLPGWLKWKKHFNQMLEIL